MSATTIFILDDDRFFGAVLKAKLGKDQVQVHHFTTIEECQKYLNIEPDILILDHTLEGATGLDFIDEVKSFCGSKTHILYVSSQEHVHISLKALRAGALEYIEKNAQVYESIESSIQRISKLTKNFKNSIDILQYRAHSNW